MRKEKINKRIFLRVLCVFLCFLCVKLNSCDKTKEKNTQIEDIELQTVVMLPDPLRVKAEEIASSMTDRQLASQVIITGIDGRGYLPPHMKALLEEAPAGGIMLFRYNLDTDTDSIRALIAETASFITEKAGVRPFIAVDFEGGEVNRFRGNTDLPRASALPSAASYWELSKQQGESVALYRIRNDALLAGKEIASLGVNMNFAPVAEFLNDYNRGFLKYRSYGPDPNFTAKASAAFFYGMKEAGILCVPKHFPGSAGDDPHFSYSVLNLKIGSLWKEDLALAGFVYPFSDLFSKGASAVMMSHTLIPDLDNEIASLSSIAMNDWLREEMGFNGIIIADDFSMSAASFSGFTPEQAAVESIASGADMVIIWQHKLKITYNEFMAALEDGRLSRERLLKAAVNIVYEKLVTSD